jgi:uncharacterized protein (TIRG00374 family)
LKTFFKILFAAAILYWLIMQNKLDFSLVGKAFNYPLACLSIFLLLIGQLFLGTYRWNILLRIKSSDIGFRKVVGIQWIGQFFSVTLPGSIAGDLIKIGYAHSMNKKLSKKYLFFTILLDRIIGMTALFFIAGVVSLFFFEELTLLEPLFENIIYINLFLFVGSFGFLSLFFINTKWQRKILRFMPHQKLKSLLEILWTISDRKKDVLIALFVSLFIHFISIISFWIINFPFFEKQIPLHYLATLIPIGHVAVALPISPAGLGVGHAAYAKLFQYLGHSNGASLFNIYWVMTALVSLMGFIPYLFVRSSNPEVHLRDL